jgi:hypothetical protein
MIKKILVSLTVVAAMSTTAFSASQDVRNKLNKMQKEIQSLKSLIKKATKKANHAKMLANNDNLKFSVDFRTSVDQISYKMVSKDANGEDTKKNDGLLTNRLWLKAAYAPSDKVSFRSILSYNKAYGDTANHSQSNTNPGYADFDWVTNENATDNNIKLKEAYWLYQNDTFMGTNIAWTASAGRRPSTDGLGINLRENQDAKSPLSHTVNVEFDGASFRFNLDKITPLTGSWIKLCMGRGLTNATPRFTQDGTDYAEDKTLHGNADMVGLIFVPYDDGQYSIHTQYAKAKNMIGFNQDDMNSYGLAKKTYMQDKTGDNYVKYIEARNNMKFKDQGDLILSNIMFKAEGLGNEINDFLDNTTLILSVAQSQTKSNGEMLGSLENQTGHSEWVALNMPAGDDARFGLEWNKGSKYWRPVTYAEDTIIGSKLAARGTAVEAYYNRDLTKALSMSLRATKITYDYTGSNSFFGSDGTPRTMDEAKALYAQGRGGNVVESAEDVRFAINYRY